MSLGIGVDGGGTKTDCILVDDSGAIAARHLAPGCNPSIVGPDEARRIVLDALGAIRAAAQAPVTATLLCMAGSRPLWRDFAAGLADFGRVIAVDDSLPILELATGGGPGLVLHAGTGSFVAARGKAGPAAGSRKSAPFGEVCYAGGFGWRLGDPGSGHDIGRRAIAQALLELQGWAPPSGLGDLVRGRTGLSGEQEIKRHYHAGDGANPEIAGLAPDVLRLAGEGDPAAAAVVADSVGGLLDIAVKVASRLFPGTLPGALRAGLSGPILTHPAATAALAAAGSGLALSPIAGTPIDGVRLLLGRLRDRPGVSAFSTP